MTVESIIKELGSRNPAWSREEVRAVATDIFYSGEPTREILGSDKLLDKLLTGFASRQASSADRVAADDPNTCPICKLPLQPVILAEGRHAVFCSKHFVVYPVKKPKTEEK